jgi:L-threonylcarbamoyladenylate synthase
MARASRCIREGGLVIFPTSCLYGIGVDALNPEAIQRVFQAKGRPEIKPLLILVPDMASALNQVEDLSSEALRLMEIFWPGGLTLVLRAKGHLLPSLTAGTGKIGIRIPQHPVAAALVRAVGGPITGTSANLSGQPGAARVADVDPSVRRTADLILDAGPLQGGAGSTVLDMTLSPPRILREGAVSAEKILNALGGKRQSR